jgi:hypothetical protein
MSCDGCGRRFREPRRLAPMLKDEVWTQLADEYECLCPECMFARARSRGIKLKFSDLRPCPFNLRERRRSWFDLFLGVEKQKPDLEPWRETFEWMEKARGGAVSGRSEPSP